MKTRKCYICKKACDPKTMLPMTPLRLVCSQECQSKGIAKALDKSRKNKEKEYKKETIKIKEQYESIADCAIKLSQACNKVVRERDYNKPCISCNKPIKKVWKNYHAGHFIPYGSKYKYSPLRFDLRNIHGQCANCNTYRGGVPADYQQGLINRFGKWYVEEIYQLKRMVDAGEIKPLTKEQMKDLTKHYRAMARELNKKRQL